MCSGYAPNVKELRDLVRLFATGRLPEEDFRQLFEVYYPRLRGFFRKKTGCTAEDAEDLTQETFKRVYRHYGKSGEFTEVEAFERWLFEVAANVFRNWLRDNHAAKRRGLELSLDAIEGATQLLAEVARTGEWTQDNPLADCLDRERLTRISRALHELPAKMHRCAWLFYGQGLKIREIAVITGVEVNTVKAHLHHARKKLREILGPLFDDPRTEDDEA